MIYSIAIFEKLNSLTAYKRQINVAFKFNKTFPFGNKLSIKAKFGQILCNLTTHNVIQKPCRGVLA